MIDCDKEWGASAPSWDGGFLNNYVYVCLLKRRTAVSSSRCCMLHLVNVISDFADVSSSLIGWHGWNLSRSVSKHTPTSVRNFDIITCNTGVQVALQELTWKPQLNITRAVVYQIPLIPKAVIYHASESFPPSPTLATYLSEMCLNVIPLCLRSFKWTLASGLPTSILNSFIPPAHIF